MFTLLCIYNIMQEVSTIRIQNILFPIPSLAKLQKDSFPPLTNRPDQIKPLLTLGEVPDVH